MFVSADGRRACRRGAIGSTMGAYPRGTGSNPVEGNEHILPSYRQLYLSSFSDTDTHIHTHTPVFSRVSEQLHECHAFRSKHLTLLNEELFSITSAIVESNSIQ